MLVLNRLPTCCEDGTCLPARGFKAIVVVHEIHRLRIIGVLNRGRQNRRSDVLDRRTDRPTELTLISRDESEPFDMVASNADGDVLLSVSRRARLTCVADTREYYSVSRSIGITRDPN